MKAASSEERSFLLILYQTVGNTAQNSSSRDLGSERTQTELPSAILITAETAFVEQKMAVAEVAMSQ